MQKHQSTSSPCPNIFWNINMRSKYDQAPIESNNAVWDDNERLYSKANLSYKSIQSVENRFSQKVNLFLNKL